MENKNFNVEMLPPQYKPLGAWTYFGLSLLFSVPIVGFIFMIVFSFDSSNINRRNYARSFFCWLIIIVALTIILLIIGAFTGLLAEIFSGNSYYSYY